MPKMPLYFMAKFLNNHKIVVHMVSGRIKSRTYRRVSVKTPGSKTVTHYRKRAPGKAVCKDCNKVLSGVARGRPYQIKKLSKTQRRPERAFGGVLCSSCSKRQIIKSIRTTRTE